MPRYVPYTVNQPKNKDILIFAHISYFKETFNLVIFCSIRPLVASGEKPKVFFFLTFLLNLNIIRIFIIFL